MDSYAPGPDVNWAEIGIDPIDLNRDEAMNAQRRQQISAAVQTWSGQLIDLGGRNQLLYYRDLKVGTLDLADADPVAVDSLMDGRTIPLSRLFGAEVLAERLKRARAIRNKSREALEERGIVTCFLAVGMATWTNTAGTTTPAAPILLREASIAAVGAGEDDFQISLTGETDINPTLLHLLEERFAVSVTADVVDLIDDERFDPQPVFTLIEKEAAAVPGFVITPRRVLGTFSYAKLPMVADLEANLDALMSHEVVAAIAGNRQAQIGLSSSGQSVDISDPDRRPPADEFLVLDADSSQSYAINAVGGWSISRCLRTARDGEEPDHREPDRHPCRPRSERAVRRRETSRNRRRARPAGSCRTGRSRARSSRRRRLASCDRRKARRRLEVSRNGGPT